MLARVAGLKVKLASGAPRLFNRPGRSPVYTKTRGIIMKTILRTASLAAAFALAACGGSDTAATDANNAAGTAADMEVNTLDAAAGTIENVADNASGNMADALDNQAEAVTNAADAAADSAANTASNAQ